MSRSGAGRVLALILTMGLVSSACSAVPQTTAPGSVGPASEAPSQAGPSGQSEGTIRYLGLGPQQGLDTLEVQGDSARAQVHLIADNLVEFDENGELTLGLAESFESDADQKVWTFHLRPDLKFSDGSPITAEDVKWSVDRMRTSENMKIILAGVEDVSIADESTIEVTLSQGSRKLPSLLAVFGTGAILKQSAVEGDPNYWQLPDATSGPYMMVSNTPKDRAVYVANPYYWRAGFPRTKNLIQIYSEDQGSWAAAIESGTADAAAIGYNDAQRLRAEGRITVEQDDGSPFAPVFWGWDRTKAPFDSKLVRQAFAWASDREGRLEACWFGTGDLTWGNTLRPWDPMYTQIDKYKAERAAALQKAGELLDEAGWVVGPDGSRVAKGVEGVADGEKFSVEVEYEGDWPASECNTLLLQSTMKEVGVDVVPVKDGSGNYWGRVLDNEFIMYHGGAGAIDADDLYLNHFRSGGASTATATRLNDPEIDAKIDAAIAADPATAKEIYAELEEWQAEELPWLIVGYQYSQTALAPGLEGYYSAPQSGLKWLANATIEP